MFDFVVLAGVCFMVVFTISQGINFWVIGSLISLLFLVRKYLASRYNAFKAVVNIFDKTAELHELINDRKELICEFGINYNVVVYEFNVMHNKYAANIGSFIRGYSLADEENVRDYINQLFELVIFDNDDKQKLDIINNKIKNTIGEYLYAANMFIKYLKYKNWYWGVNCRIDFFYDDSDKLMFGMAKKVYPLVRC